MNQDFTEKKATFVSKKKFEQRVSPGKKFLHKQWAKKNSCKLKIPLPPTLPTTFFNGPSLTSMWFLLFYSQKSLL